MVKGYVIVRGIDIIVWYKGYCIRVCFGVR